MYRQLLETLNTLPAEYESTGIPFWNDAHISQSMLAAHLPRRRENTEQGA